MKEGTKRILTGIVFTIVVVSVVVLKNNILDSIFVTLLSFMGIYEYNKCFKNKDYHPIPLIGYLSSLAILLIGNVETVLLLKTLGVLVPVVLVFMFGYIVIKKLEVTVIDIAITLLSIIYIPVLFSFLKLLFLQPDGRVLVSLAFACAVATDTMAYEIGSRFGKHKLCPVVSPKKSVEGSVAGIVAAMIVALIVSIISNTYFNTGYNIIVMAIIGAVLSVVGQIGDLAASSIKRFCGQKDFSHLLPGHGGILDRFDSLLFVSPVLYAIMYIINLI